MLVKHSKRSLRAACPVCGVGGSDDTDTVLYYAHDPSQPENSFCDDCGSNGKIVLVEAPASRKNAITLHSCSQTGKKAISVVTVEGFEPGKGGAENDLALLRKILNNGELDESLIQRMINEKFANTVFPTRLIVKDAETKEKKEFPEVSHAQLGDVITTIQTGEHVMMVGPAGTGKSTIAEQAAKALGLKYYSISLNPQLPASQLMGYMEATGKYVPMPFRKAYEEGGLFHLDEVDNSHPSVLAVINSALANGIMAFPDTGVTGEMVTRHPDFRVAASANTFGKGADRTYVGRQAMDGATLDRFTIETINYDEALETTLCMNTGAKVTDVERVLKTVRTMRKNAEKYNLRVILSPRATVGMCKLMHAGNSWNEAVSKRLRRGMDQSTWDKLIEGV